MFAHSAGDFVDGLVDAFVHVFGLTGGFDDDVVGAKEKDFRDVAVFLNIENGFGFDDARVV